jgi:hypothetical protein
MYKNSFPYCGLTRPLRAMILTSLILYNVRKLPCNLSFSDTVLLEKIFKLFSYINKCKNSFPNFGPTLPPESFHGNLRFSGPVVLEKKNF